MSKHSKRQAVRRLLLQNWSDEARRKSLETRRRNAKLGGGAIGASSALATGIGGKGLAQTLLRSGINSKNPALIGLGVLTGLGQIPAQLLARKGAKKVSKKLFGEVGEKAAGTGHTAGVLGGIGAGVGKNIAGLKYQAKHANKLRGFAQKGKLVDAKSWVKARDKNVKVISSLEDLASVKGLKDFDRIQLEQATAMIGGGANAFAGQAKINGKVTSFIIAPKKVSHDVLAHELGHIKDFAKKGSAKSWESDTIGTFLGQQFRREARAWKEAGVAPNKIALGSYKAARRGARVGGATGAGIGIAVGSSKDKKKTTKEIVKGTGKLAVDLALPHNVWMAKEAYKMQRFKKRSKKKLTRNWSDEARKAALEARRRKSKGKSGHLKTAGKVGGGILAGALVGGFLGGKGLARILARGRKIRPGENLVGKVLYTEAKGAASSWKPSQIVPTPSGRSATTLLRRAAKRKRKGVIGKTKGAVAKVVKKIDDSLAVPERHYGVGTGKNEITHYSVDGVEKSKRGAFSRFWKEGTARKGDQVRVVDEGKVVGKLGKKRTAAKDELEKQVRFRGRWQGKDLVCMGSKNCETFARGIAEGTNPQEAKYLKDLKKGLAYGTGIGAGAGGTGAAALEYKKRKKKRPTMNREVRALVTVINGGPGSGHHGHKGIPGQRGGSLPADGSAPSGHRPAPSQARVSESPQATARRRKSAFTRTAKLAEVYSGYADEIEEEVKKKLVIPKKTRAELFELHAKAADNYKMSAEQATLVKGKTTGEQIDRLRKSKYHEEQARKHAKKLGRRIPGGKFISETAKSFASEVVGGSARGLGRIGADIAKSSLRGGAAQAVRQSKIKVADVDGERKPTAVETARAIRDAMAKAARQRTTEHRDKYIKGDRGIDFDEVRRYHETLRKLDRQKQFLRGRVGELRKKPKELWTTEEWERVQKLARGEPLTNESSEENGTYTTVTANLSTGVQRKELHGREYLVAPLTMIVPGVLNGSKGPLLYPEEEVSKNPEAWNNMPIVVNHPTKNGSPVLARDPEVLERYQIGTVFNSKYNGKLVAEGWFDLERTRKTNIGIYQKLTNNQPIELSTGLYTENEPFEGVWNNRAYKYVARNYRPDHLAILLGSRGACSISDGCGVLINKCSGKDKKKKKPYFKEQIYNKGLIRAVGSTIKSAVKAPNDLRKFVNKNPKKAAVAAGATGYFLGKNKKKKKKKSGLSAGSALAGGAVGYELGRRKKAVRNEVRQIVNFLGISKKRKEKFKKGAKIAGGAATGAGATMAGMKVGGAIGTALGGPGIGTVAGGAIGAAAGGYLGSKTARKYGGETAGKAADIGGLAGAVGGGVAAKGVTRGAAKLFGRVPKAAKSLAPTKAVVGARTGKNFANTGRAKMGEFMTPTAKTGAAKAAKVSKARKFRAKRFAKGAGMMGVDAGAYMGTDAALRRLDRPRKRKPQFSQNAWTDEARRKSLETRRRNRQLAMETGGAIGAGYVAARALGRVAGKAIEPKNLGESYKKVAKKARESFKDVPKHKYDYKTQRFEKTKPGLGRKTLRLLYKLKKVRFR